MFDLFAKNRSFDLRNASKNKKDLQPNEESDLRMAQYSDERAAQMRQPRSIPIVLNP